MKKNSILLIVSVLAVVVSSNLYAQSTWSWARQGKQCPGPTPLTEGGPTAIDPHGNIYVAAHFSGDCVSFGTDTIFNPMPGSYVPMFIAKYDSLGNYKWSRYASSGNYGYSGAIAADDSGNIYDAGVFFGSSITFGSFTLYAAGIPAPYLVKYDSNGTVLWAKNCTGSVSNCVVTTSPDGSIYITGAFTGSTFTAGTYTLTNPGLSERIFLVKYDAAGNVLWAQQSNGSGNDVANQASCDAAGNIYLVGKFTSPTLTFGSSTITNTVPGTNNLFIVKYTSAGTPRWAKESELGESSSGPSVEAGLIADHAGNVYITGAFYSDSMVIGSYHFHNTTTASTYSDAFVAKYDSSGNLQWAKQGSGNKSDFGFHFAIDIAGNVWLAGGSLSTTVTLDTAHIAIPTSLMNDASFLVEFDPYGNVKYRSALSCGGDDYLGIGTDSHGNIYIAGDFMGGPNYIGPDTITAIGSETFFLAKLGHIIDPSTLETKVLAGNIDILLFPNPARNEVTLKISGTGYSSSVVRISNSIGQAVKTIALTGSTTTINTSDLPSGLYLCSITIDDETTVRKIAITH